MKRILLIILSILTISIGFFSYKYYFTNTKNLNSIHLIPRDAIYFVASDTPIQNWKTIRDSDIWKHLQTNSYFATLTTSVNTLDSILNDNEKFFDLLGSKKVMVSAHPISKRKYDFLFIVDLKKTAKFLQFKRFLKTLIGDNFSISERIYKDIEILEIFDKKTRDTLYLSVIDNNLVASYTHTLVEAAISQINESTIGRDLKFIAINKQLDNDDLLRVFVQYNYVDEFVEILTNSTTNKWLNDLSKSLVFSGFDIALKANNKIIAKGYTNTNEHHISYLQAFENAGLGTQSCAEVSPHRTSMYLSLGFDNFTTFYNNYKSIQDKNLKQFGEVDKNTKKIESLLDIDIQKNFIDWIDDEVALLKLEPISQNEKMDFAVVLKAKRTALATKNLRFILKQIKKKTPVKFKQIKYKGYPINFMSIKGFFKVFLGGYFKDLEKPYFTIIDDFVVFSNHPNTLKYIITNYIEKNTLSKATNYKEFKSSFDNKSNLFIYINTPMIYSSILNHVGTSTQKQLIKNKAYFTSFTQLGIQLYPKKDLFKSSFIIQYQDQESILYSEEFKLPTVGPLLKKDTSSDSSNAPLFVTTSDREIIEITPINPPDLNAKRYTEKYSNGQLKIVAKMKDGVLHGRYREYYNNGETKIKGYFKKGKRSGRWKKYDKKGDRIVSVRY